MIDEAEKKRRELVADEAWEGVRLLLLNDAGGGAGCVILTILLRFLINFGRHADVQLRRSFAQDILNILNETLDVNTKLLNNKRKK